VAVLRIALSRAAASRNDRPAAAYQATPRWSD